MIQKHTKHTLFAVLLDRFAVLNTVFWVAVFLDLGWDTMLLCHLNAEPELFSSTEPSGR